MNKVENIYNLELKPFGQIAKEWMLITAKKPDGTVNTMTASWGGIGILWGKPTATCYIRQSRFTKEFVDSGDTFTLSFFGGAQMQALKYLGTVSGRDEDKIAKSGLTLCEVDGEPTFAEATMTFVCKKMYSDFMPKEQFIDPEADARWYADKDYHTMYIAEILGAYTK